MASSGEKRLRRAGIDTTLLTRGPAVLHPLATATPSLLADNTIRLLAPRAIPAPGGPKQIGGTKHRRWYPTLIETADGRYPSHLQDSLTTVKQVERYDPASGRWTWLPRSADRDLPLCPRLHLLANGRVFYDAAGQDFNPFGQSIGELDWMYLASNVRPGSTFGIRLARAAREGCRERRARAQQRSRTSSTPTSAL